MSEERKEHTILPVFDKESEILILGSFPSVKSRETGFYYGHPQNRFWKLLAEIYESDIPKSNEEKKIFLQKNHIALWDVIASCEINGSSDASISNIEYNDIYEIIEKASIKKIILNGGKAYELFMKKYKNDKLPEIYKMPSTSPANAMWSLKKLVDKWEIIKE